MQNKSKTAYKQQLLNDFNSRNNYDKGRFYIPIANKLVEFANLQNGQKILDVATGTGIVALNAAQKVGNGGKVIGIDISTGMLKNAKQKLAEIGLHNVEFIEADAENLNFAENSFDAILCSLAVCYLTDIPAAFQKWQRFLKTDGFIAFNVWSENAFPPSVLFREVARRYGINVPNPNKPMGTIERCNQLLDEIGFKKIEVETEQFGWYFKADETIAEDIWWMNANNVFGYQVLQLSTDKLEECKTEYIKEMQALAITEKDVWCDAPIFFVRAIM
ncbi:class I SAM-dependent methyltransferase [Rivularia sp. UHCC 0363]|uniref:class I SAM-dependent methyltransferase n=1 Tax=Rivularia sp. UHCC 0363 TaxID=3110244 RepID=UPI002B1F44D1|nr:methyltransferase domain-containing protein [Rivularia sp. UHCC 0363]MEA5597020.1 methyltransferase domain-containing protein [Rivularia sp. UHCC 0363]